MITVEFEKLGIQAGYRILDIGCGTGRHTCFACRFKQVTVTGADINYHDVLEAKSRLIYQEKLGESGGLFHTLVTDIVSLPFRNNFFDLVICSEVLEHVHDHQAAAKEMIRVLKQNGDLVVSVPRYFPECICWALSKDYRNTEKGHIRIYKKKDLITLLENAGVKNWAVRFSHSLHTPYWWLKCLVGPARDDSVPVNLYHRFLTWDIMNRPRITRFLDRLLNPVLGKSIVLYFQKAK